LSNPFFDIKEEKNDVSDRFLNYNKPHCWQYDMRLKTLNEDLELIKDIIKVDELSINDDFIFSYIDKNSKVQCKEIVDFIERYEWLGKMPVWVTHRFIAREKNTGILVGVVVMATPNSFSNILGVEYKNKEKLIARGACISWAPKNFASWLIMKSIKWMVNNTEFRFFSGYSDPEAKELGTIYQACNFYYIGQSFGAKYQYFDENNPERGWVGDSYFNYRSTIIKYSKKLKIIWRDDWYGGKGKYKRKIKWSAIPEDVKALIKEERNKHRDGCIKREISPKHKYVYILGRDKRESKYLKKKFIELNPDKINLSYPKIRGK